VTTGTTEIEFTNLVPTAEALDCVSSILNNLNVNLGFYKINKILHINRRNARDRILNPNLPARNGYIDIQYK
ncbi:hypothetical protein QR685DRAFT_445837, partial [Neurospora intermedia]